VCEGDPCSETSPPDIEAGGSGGEAGRAGAGRVEPDCRRDRDCRNEVRCDGSETCVDGECVSGEPVECEMGTQCVEDGAELCVYAPLSPWLVLTASEELSGLPLAGIAAGGEHASLRTLAIRERSGPVQGFDRVFWAPKGRVALVRSLEREFGYRLELLRVGSGVSSTVKAVPNLPNWGNFAEPVFSRDGARALISDDYSGSYLLELHDESVPLRQVNLETAVTLQFCADSRFWLESPWNGEGAQLAALEEGEITRRELGSGFATASPDGQFYGLTLVDEDEEAVGARIGACSDDGSWSYDFPEAEDVSFSADSQLLLLRLIDGGTKVMSLADPQAPVELWSSPTARVSQDRPFVAGHYALVTAAVDDGEPTLHVVDPELGPGAQLKSLDLPPTVDVVAVTDTALLGWVSHVEDEGRDLVWQALPPTEAPRPLLSIAAGQTATVHDVGNPRFRLVSVPSLQEAQLYLLQIDRGVPAQAPLVTLPGSLLSTALAPDDSGLAVVMLGATIDSLLHWIPLSTDGAAGQKIELASNVFTTKFEPWP
jgi:hypothetical protein